MNVEEKIDLKSKGTNQAVSKMYSDVSPYPGRYIRLLTDKNSFRQSFYTALSRKYDFNVEAAQRFAKARLKDSCPDFNAQVSILDVGCGTGEITMRFAMAFPNAKVVGIDNSEGSLEWARRLQKYYNVTNLEFIRVNAETDSLETVCKGQKFDVINCSGVLHHIRDPFKALKNMVSVMKDNTSVLWLFLYADFGRHLENSLRQGLRYLIPDDNKLKERTKLAKDMRWDRRILGMYGVIGTYGNSKIRTLCEFSWNLRLFMINLKNFGYTAYTDRLEDTDIYDAFSHPIVEFYNSDKIKALMDATGLELKNFQLYPTNPFFESKISPYIQGRDIMSKLQTLECLYYPDSYYLHLTKKGA